MHQTAFFSGAFSTSQKDNWYEFVFSYFFWVPGSIMFVYDFFFFFVLVVFDIIASKYYLKKISLGDVEMMKKMRFLLFDLKYEFFLDYFFS